MIHHNLIEFFVFHISTRALDLILEHIDGLQVLSLLLVTFLLGKLLDSLVELLIFLFRLFLLKLLDFVLLLEKLALNFGHMSIILEHLSEEVVRSRNWHLSLHKNLHSLHHVLAGGVIERYLAFDIVVNFQ